MKIWVSQGAGSEDYWLPKCDAVYFPLAVTSFWQQRAASDVSKHRRRLSICTELHLLQSVDKHSICVFRNIISWFLFSTFAILCFPSLFIPSFSFWILFFYLCSFLPLSSFYSTFLSTFLFLRPLSLPPLPLHTHVAYWGSYLYQGFVGFSP